MYELAQSDNSTLKSTVLVSLFIKTKFNNSHLFTPVGNLFSNPSPGNLDYGHFKPAYEVHHQDDNAMDPLKQTTNMSFIGKLKSWLAPKTDPTRFTPLKHITPTINKLMP